MDAALRSPELFAVIVAYQAGISADLHPLAVFAKKTLETPVLARRGSGGRSVRNRSKHLVAFAELFAPWYDRFGRRHLVRLFAALPRIGPLCFAHAVAYGNIPLLRYLHAAERASAPSCAPALAAGHGQLTALVFLRTHGYTGFDRRCFECAAQHGDVGTMVYLFAACATVAPAPTHLLALAAAAGHQPLVEYFAANHIVDASLSTALDAAAAAGHVAVTRFLHDEGFACSTDAMDGAAAGSHLTVLRFLHAQRAEGCSAKAISTAAKHGHLEVVRFLCEVVRAPCDPDLLDVAVGGGHLDVVAYLVSQRASLPLAVSVEAFDEVCAKGHLAVAQFLHAQLPGVLCSSRAMDAAAANGHLAVVAFLDAHRGEGCSTLALDQAATNGYLDVVKYLHRHRREGCTQEAMDMAATNGYLDVVRFLHRHRTEGCSTWAMDFASKHGHLEVVRFLHSHRREGCTDDALNMAAQQGHLEVVRFLCEHRTEGNLLEALANASANHHDAVERYLLSVLSREPWPER
ncbi:hypothetical protein ACHHYP_08227 [Achlya hypogyna]|uniref:Uncharacterized protein n=1 Tax=Achlya hypogyna TaxID=1202772 RepID=A0A1V9ZL74_ACHHY|nr:hypothetical protein ACHHYP_08227 [Achlya hypogyna]